MCIDECRQLGPITLDNASNNSTLSETVEDVHTGLGLEWSATKNQLSCVNMSELDLNSSFTRCLAHVVNLAVGDFMKSVTSVAALESREAIWNFDPQQPTSRVLGNRLDVIAHLRTLGIKVRLNSFHKAVC